MYIEFLYFRPCNSNQSISHDISESFNGTLTTEIASPTHIDANSIDVVSVVVALE